MKTILILCPSISGLGGVERVVISLANELAKDNKVIIGTLYTPAPEYKIDSRIKCICMEDCRYKYSRIFSYLLRKLVRNGIIKLKVKYIKKLFYPKYRLDAFNRYIKECMVDDIIGVGIDMTMIASYAKQSDDRIRVIGWQHNEFRLYFEKPSEYYYGLLELFNLRSEYIDENIVITNKEKNIFDEKSTVRSRRIYNPLCIDRIDNDNLYNCDKKNILFVGRIAKQQKGIDFLIDILKKVFAPNIKSEWTVTVVGDGPDLEFLKNEVKKSGLETNISIVGGVNDVAEYYKKSSVLISTSRWEGFGLVITEAMYYGLGVVAFENEGPSEIIHDGFDGILIPKYDIKKFVERLRFLMEDDNMRKEISKNAIISSEKYLPNMIYNEWKKIV